MKKLLLTLAVVISTSASATHAQDKAKTVGANDRPGSVSNTVPDWQSSYQQEVARDYIRRRAQEKTAARQARIEGMRWLGHSPARPVVSSTPFMSSAPSWVSFAPMGYWGPAFWPSRAPVSASDWLP